MATERQTLRDIGETGGGRNPSQETRFLELEKANAEGNKFGIESPAGSFLEPEASAFDAGAFKQPDFNLPELFESLTASSGVRGIEDTLTARSRSRDS